MNKNSDDYKAGWYDGFHAAMEKNCKKDFKIKDEKFFCTKCKYFIDLSIVNYRYDHASSSLKLCCAFEDDCPQNKREATND